MRTVLSIGREPDNDYVIDLPIVSGHHARVTWEGMPGQALIEDLGSSNGTAIGQLDRKVTRAVFSAADTLYFGNRAVPGSDLLAWVDPSLAPSLVLQGNEMVVGRDPGCHRVIERSTVSGRHARFRRSGGRIILEDLGSSNGTYVNDHRVEGPTEVRAGDLIVLGSDAFRLELGHAAASTQRMAAPRPPGPSAPIPAPTMMVDSRKGTSTGLAAGSPASAPWIRPATLVALVLQAPTLAIGIGLMSTTEASVPAALFALGLASLWFGLSTAVFGILLDPDRPDSGPAADQGSFWLNRALILGGLCVLECLLALGVVSAPGGLKGPGLSAFGLVFLGSGVGLGLGFLIVLLAPKPPVAFAALAGLLVALGLFGGGPGSLPRSASVVRLASNAAPSRWAFEGLLVSEAASRPATLPAPADAAKADSAVGRDLAEAYFPAEDDRMGPRADAMALGSMLVGLVGVGLFLVRFSGDAR